MSKLPEQLVRYEERANRATVYSKRDVVWPVPRTHLICPQHLEESWGWSANEPTRIQHIAASLVKHDALPRELCLLQLGCNLQAWDQGYLWSQEGTHDTHFRALQHLDEAVHVRAVHMDLDEFVPCTHQGLIARPACLRHDVVEHGVAHPPGRGDDNGAEGGGRVRDMPKEGGIQRGVEPGQPLSWATPSQRRDQYVSSGPTFSCAEAPVDNFRGMGTSRRWRMTVMCSESRQKIAVPVDRRVHTIS